MRRLDLVEQGQGRRQRGHAPSAIGEDIPRARWLKVGARVGVSVFAAISFAHRDEIANAIQWLHPPQDAVPGPP